MTIERRYIFTFFFEPNNLLLINMTSFKLAWFLMRIPFLYSNWIELYLNMDIDLFTTVYTKAQISIIVSSFFLTRNNHLSN